MSLRVETTIHAPPEVVWIHLEDIASHIEWMADAVSIEFLTAQRSGNGTRFSCKTRVGSCPRPTSWRSRSGYRRG